MKGHKDFIKTTISQILEEAVVATSSIGDGIETYPLSEYIMQTIFLKMTGFQEQKMKCICWELASRDYEYRYKRYTQNSLGECSSYDEKNTIFGDLYSQIHKYDKNWKIENEVKKKIRNKVFSDLNRLLLGTNIKIWKQKSYDELFQEIRNTLPHTHFANDKTNLLGDNSNNVSPQKIYKDHLYKHRNRLAHNTLSYQQNLPTLSVLQAEEYKYDNYFLWFAILIIIDEVFIELYKHYLDVYDETKY